jgi:O-antigen ligase
MHRERPNPASIDLRRAARLLSSALSAALILLGLFSGLAADRLRPSLQQRTFAVSLPKVVCREPVDALPPPAELRLPAGVLAGYLPADANVPPPLRDIYVGCRLRPLGERSIATCAVRGADAAGVEAIARAAQAEIGLAQSSFAIELSDLRIIESCGLDYFTKLVSAPKGSTNPKSGHHATPAVLAARAPLLGDARPLPSPPEAAVPRTTRGALIGTLAGALLAALAAAWRARIQGAPLLDSLPRNRLASAALAGLMLTASMDQALAFKLGGFTVRAAQFCALLLLAAAIAERSRLARPLALPAAPVLATLAYLCVCAISALGADCPPKSVGYLAWASFDLFVVLVGVTLYAGTAERLESAMRWWWGGMALGAAMGFFQIIAWRLGIKPPFVTTDNFGFPRINGFNYEPSYFALYLVPGALVLFTRFALLGRSARWSAWIAGVLLLAIALSTSRSGWIGMGLGLVALAVRTGLRLGPKAAARLGAASAAVVAVLCLVLASWPALRMTVVNMARMGMDVHEVTSAGPRVEAMRQAFVLFTRAPLLGVGFGNYGAYVLSHPELPNLLPPDAKALVTTNLYLEIASETGALGFAGALAALFFLIRPLWRATRAHGLAAPDRGFATAEGLLLGSLVVFLVLYQFSQTLWRLDVWVLLSLCLAAAAAASSTPAASARDAGGHD